LAVTVTSTLNNTDLPNFMMSTVEGEIIKLNPVSVIMVATKKIAIFVFLFISNLRIEFLLTPYKT
jgi:hypothetical protein